MRIMSSKLVPVKDFISFALSTTKTYKLILLTIEKKITATEFLGFVTQYDNMPEKAMR